ncbi:MAG TPA: molybdopterin molybdotransferase MoeA [Syntrophales bacterium]|nr:molybdopterin molybdotransferase MoeA [Syntrophales bacterium]HPI57158.1 molybdopterin molybdotransferase MoeA [Syntrophales bacterium]HPN24755.1 molybdopterin molybdotransferase MoeA [Syntrophales bacterium]HQM29885.1 molybdopterin molybdotransferase MoeA [Syntrophales bacterium]
MISVDKALEQILGAIHTLGLEKVPILDALGRVLGQDVTSDRDIPPLPNSAMDGYALRFEDTRGASREKPAVLTVVDDVRAGRISKKTIRRGHAVRIMTGAPIPKGADAVTRVEDTEKDGDRVRVFAPAKKGLDIRPAGEDVKKGELVIPKGKVIRPAEVGMLAALNRSDVTVHRRPKVAILSTGDELVDLGGDPAPGMIMNSNSYSLAAQVAECGAVPLRLGIARDTREDLMSKFEAARGADLIVTSGGVSVGDYDLVKDVMGELGAMRFWRVAMRPGRPLAFGAIKGTPLFGLPGNPVSVMVSFEQFVRPAILKMSGFKNLFRVTVKALLKENLEKVAGLRFFLRAVVEWKDGKYYAVTTGEQGSGILKSMVKANGLIILPEDVTSMKAGDEVTVQLLDRSFETASKPWNP